MCSGRFCFQPKIKKTVASPINFFALFQRSYSPTITHYETFLQYTACLLSYSLPIATERLYNLNAVRAFATGLPVPSNPILGTRGKAVVLATRQHRSEHAVTTIGPKTLNVIGTRISEMPYIRLVIRPHR